MFVRSLKSFLFREALISYRSWRSFDFSSVAGHVQENTLGTVDFFNALLILFEPGNHKKKIKQAINFQQQKNIHVYFNRDV
jgi:hypothetical protein